VILPNGEVRVAFTADDVRQAVAFADAMCEHKPNVRRSKFFGTERMDNEVAGKLGEVAFGRVFGWPVDWALHAGGDTHADFTVQHGWTVDIKAVNVQRSLTHDYALPLALHEVIADVFVQALIEPGRVAGRLTGWIGHAAFLWHCRREAGWRDRGDDPFVVTRRQLTLPFHASFWRDREQH
jgi:hypothetical protein